MLRALGEFYGRHSHIDPKSSFPALRKSQSVCKRVKFEVKVKIGKKYEKRSLEFVPREEEEKGNNEWILYIVKYADYTSYDYFRLSTSFITQLFDEHDSKCILVLAEEVLRLKMSTLSDKWRLVEFLRANMTSRLAHTSTGLIESSPALKGAPSQVRVYLKSTTLVVIDRLTKRIMAHKSLNLFEMLICKEKKVSFVCKKSNEEGSVSEFWSIRVEKLDVLAVKLGEEIVQNGMSLPFTHVHELPKYVTMPTVLYTDC